MITGVHAVVYNRKADKLREFFRDVLGFNSVDAGHGWLIFALPPAELGIHPTEGKGLHEFYLMCDDHTNTKHPRPRGPQLPADCTSRINAPVY